MMYRAGRIPIHPEACAICGSRNNVQAAHIRMANRGYGKRDTGAGEKSSDRFTCPLCPAHHAEQHSGSEAEFWKRHAIDPFFIATALYAHSGDEDAAADVIALARTKT